MPHSDYGVLIFSKTITAIVPIFSLLNEGANFAFNYILSFICPVDHFARNQSPAVRAIHCGVLNHVENTTLVKLILVYSEIILQGAFDYK